MRRCNPIKMYYTKDLRAELSRRSTAFKKFLNCSREVIDVVRKYDLGGTWTHGMCYSLAGAVKKWLGGSARIMGLVDAEGVLQHVFVMKDGIVIDGDGFSLPGDFIGRWEQELIPETVQEGEWSWFREEEAIRPILSVRRRLSTDIGCREYRRDKAAGAAGLSNDIWKLLEKRFPVGGMIRSFE